MQKRGVGTSWGDKKPNNKQKFTKLTAKDDNGSHELWPPGASWDHNVGACRQISGKQVGLGIRIQLAAVKCRPGNDAIVVQA